MVLNSREVMGWSEENLMRHYAEAVRLCQDTSVTVLEREIARRRIAADKPVCKLTGEDGNVFAIISKVSRTLNNAGEPALSKEFTKKAFECPSYNHVLKLCSEYVEVV